MYVTSLWDQEDMYGGIHTYLATEPKDTGNDRNFLVLGPWRHSGVNYDGTELGPLKFEGNTALQFRRDVMEPFLAAHLKDGAPHADTPPVFVFETGTNHVAATERLAAVMCGGLPLATAAPVPAGGLCAWGSAPRRAARAPTTSTSRIRPSRCPTFRARCTSRTGWPGSAGWSPISARSPIAPTCSRT